MATLREIVAGSQSRSFRKAKGGQFTRSEKERNEDIIKAIVHPQWKKNIIKVIKDDMAELDEGWEDKDVAKIIKNMEQMMPKILGRLLDDAFSDAGLI